jgi:uncharacterized protein
MKAKYLIIISVFTILFAFSVVSRIFFNDFQNGWNAYEKKDYKTARELWLPLVEKGDSRAQFYLGFMHDMGFGTPKNDKEALKFYKLAAKQGDSRAQLFSGFMHEFGRGTPEDSPEAFKWYRLAAEQGSVKAQVNIYRLAKKNVPEALKFLINDAENGIPEAQYHLGGMHANGLGVSHDFILAHMWYSLSALQGHIKAGHHKNLIKERMFLQQIEQSQEMIRDWKPRK